jgi:hypothetical protein
MADEILATTARDIDDLGSKQSEARAREDLSKASMASAKSLVDESEKEVLEFKNLVEKSRSELNPGTFFTIGSLMVTSIDDYTLTLLQTGTQS